MRAELADGRILEFPDGTDPLVIQATVKKMLAPQQPQAGIPAATQPATQMAQPQIPPQPQTPQEEAGFFDVVTGESRMTPEMETMQEIGGAPELNKLSIPAFKASLGLLTTGETEPLKAILKQQLGDEVSFRDDPKGNVIVDLPSGSYALNKPGISGQDIIRGAFDIAAFTPAGRAATIPTAAVKSGVTEAGLEAAEAGVGGEFDAGEVALATGIGAGAKVIEKGIGAAARAIQGAPESPIVQAGKEAGIPVLTSDIRQPQTFAGRMTQQTGEKIPFAGTGSMREEQQKLRELALEKFADKYGEFSYGAIVKSLKTQKNKVKNAAGKVLESTGIKLDAVGEIPLTNTRKVMADVSEELSKKGVIQSGSALDDLAVLSGALNNAPQTFSTLKENRTLFREIVAGADKAERTQLTSRAKTLLGSVERAMKRDMDEIAKKNLTPQEFGKWQKANSVYAEEATKLTKTRLKNVLDKGDVTPENVKTLLFSQKPSEVDMLYKSLTTDGRSNARSAIISKVVADLNKRAAGITPNTFANEMKKYGIQSEKFFRGEEKKKLNGLLKVFDATRRAQEASITTPTGQQILGAGTALSLFTNPIETIGAGGTLGGLARLYESAPVRNALLRLDSLPPGSTQFEAALREFSEILQPAMQSLREQSQGKE